MLQEDLLDDEDISPKAQEKHDDNEKLDSSSSVCRLELSLHCNLDVIEK